MNLLHKVYALFFLGGIVFSITADAGQDSSVWTNHNGDIDSNETIFENILDGSASLGVIESYLWEQVSGPEEVTIINSTNPVASFASSVGYGGDDKEFVFKLTVSSTSGSDEDLVSVIVKPEQNEPPLVIFQGLDNFDDNSINCGGSIDGSEDGFECILLFLNDYLAEVVDPEGDNIISANWYDENNNILSDQAFSVTFTSSEPHFLIYRAIDAYGDYNDAVITIYSSVQNTYPYISILENTYYVDEYSDINGNGEWDSEEDVYSYVLLEALVSDNEHLISDIAINWEVSCISDGCNYYEDFVDSNGNGNYDEGEEFSDCGLDGICSSEDECILPDIDGSEGNGEWDQAVFLEFSDENIDLSTGIASAIFYPPEVKYNSDNVQFAITVTARDPFQQNDASIEPSLDNSTITVNNINRPLYVQSYSFDESAVEDQEFEIDFDSFQICDSDNSLEDISLILLNGNDYEIISQNENIIIPRTESDENVDIDIALLFNDGEGDNSAVNYSATINVTPVNDIPEISGILPSLDFYEDTPFILNSEDILIEDPDDDSWALYIYENEDAAYSLDGNTITPYSNYFGNLAIPIMVSDGEGDSDQYYVNIDLIPVNDPPVSTWASQGVSEFKLFINEDFEDSVLFNFNETFSDVDNLDSELIFNNPSNENFNLFNIEVDASNNLILNSIFNVNSSIADQGSLESESFQVSAQDLDGASSGIYDFEITVLPKNDPPILYSGSDYTNMSVIGGESSSLTIDLTSQEASSEEFASPYVTDVEGDSWFFQITDCPDNGNLIIGEPFDDFGIDGCDDIYEDGNGGCLETPNFGIDGCDDIYEDGDGGCLDEPNTIYISSDPNGDNFDYNGDNYDPFTNPSGTELNCSWDSGENYTDEDFSQSWDKFDTHFIYQPNPGFRCVDQIKFKVIDDGVDYIDNNGVISIEESPKESSEVIMEVFVDLCNFAPNIEAYNQNSISSINLIEDAALIVDDIDLSFFEFSDQDGNEIVSIHAISWNDYGEDGLPDTQDEGEANGEWDQGEGWNDCGLDGICPDDPDYPGPDSGEGDGQINEEVVDNLRYSVQSECSNLEYNSQLECEYNDEKWFTTVIFQENYNGTLSVAIQANDGQSAYNLSTPHIVDFYVQGVNDPPYIVNSYILNSNNDTINYLYEDDIEVEFKIDIEDIDSLEDLNDAPFNLENLIWEFDSPNQNLYASEHEPNIFFIDSLRHDWNGEEALNLKVCDESSRYCDESEFLIKVLPVNDLPYNFSARYSITDGALIDSTIFEDNIGLDENADKQIEYAISFEDVDCDPSLNNFHFDSDNESINPGPFDPAIFIPDSLIWETDYEGINIQSFSLLDFINIDNNCNEDLIYYKRIQFDSLRHNWNGFDTIPLYISSINSEIALDTAYLSVEVLPLNDTSEDFEIDSELYNYAMDQTTFYTPCELNNDPDCTEPIHGYEFSREDNFFRLHNVLDSSGDVLIQESVDYESFDVGKILFKWDRSADIDMDPILNEYYIPSLYYRLELVEAGEYIDINDNGQYDDGEPCEDINLNGECDSPSDYTFVLAEVPDDIFNVDNACLDMLGNNSLCSNEDFAFMSDTQYAWAIADMTQPFFKYKEGFFSHPNSNSGEYGFYTSVDSTAGEYGYSYIDYFGTTEYKWKVTAYNRWWDYDVNNENEVVAESDDMRFFVDLERPYCDFSVIQNPLFGELYELYMITNEEVFINESSLFINDTPYNIVPFNESDNESGYSTFFYYTGEFGTDGPGTYEFEVFTLDLLKNAGITSYSITYAYALPGNFVNINSPSGIMDLSIPDYSLINPAGFVISENDMVFNSHDKTSISKEINISASNIDLRSPMIIRFSEDLFQDFNPQHIRIGRKNINNGWDIIESELAFNYIQSNIVEDGSYALFYTEDGINELPDKFELINCYPNPFNPNINIEFSVPDEAMISVDIYDINGNKVKTLVNKNMNPGLISLEWDGLSDSGSSVSSGVYLIQIKMNQNIVMKKITMLK